MAEVVVSSVQWDTDPPPYVSGGVAHGRPILTRGTSVYLLDGPTERDGGASWHVLLGSGCCETGWVPENDATGSTTLAPRAPECPDALELLSATQIEALGRGHALGCFGSSSITLKGALFCSRPVVDAVFELVGAPWTWLSTGIHCLLDDTLLLNGEPVFAVIDEPGYTYGSGPYEVTGHFEDLASNQCEWRKGYFGMGLELPPRETAVTECRTQFVVDSVRKI